MSDHDTPEVGSGLSEVEGAWFREECMVCLGDGCRKCEAVRDEVDRILAARDAEHADRLAAVQADLADARGSLDMALASARARLARAESAEAERDEAVANLDTVRQLEAQSRGFAERLAEDLTLARLRCERLHGTGVEPTGVWLNPDGTTSPILPATMSAEVPPTDWAAVATRVTGALAEAKAERDTALREVAERDARLAKVEAPMTIAEQAHIAKAFERDRWAGEWNSLPTAIDALLQSRAALANPDGGGPETGKLAP